MRWYVRFGWGLLAASLVGWPLTQLTVARDEPPFVLGLSWFAIVLNALGIIATAYVKQDVDGGPGP